MENHVLKNRAAGRSYSSFRIEEDRLIYLQRGLFNPFRFVVHEVELKELENAQTRRSLFGCRVKLQKGNGECITIRGLETQEAADLVGVVSKKNAKDTRNTEKASIRLILTDFETRLNEILRDRAGCISRMVDLLIESAIELEASDIHIEPFDRIKVRFRIDGVLVDAVEIPFEYHSRLVSRIKVLAKAPTYEKDVPLDGRIEKQYRPGLDLRVSTFPTIRGDSVVIRIFDSGSHLFGLGEIGFSEKVLEQLTSLIMAPEGTIVLTGPSNSGKTTTIYSALETIHDAKRNSVNIVTIEDPVERDLRKFHQTQIAPARGLTFDAAIRAILRQDPNVIMVGEIRDRETANTAVRAGMTGHLVITTIHSGTAAGAFARLMEMGLEPFILTSSISGIMAQRLVRKACHACAVSKEPPTGLLQKFGIEDVIKEEKVGTGCPICAGTGYKGRTAIAELLLVDDALRKGILECLPVRELKKIACENGMIDLLRSGVEKVKCGVTNMAELARVLTPSEVQR